MRLRNDQSAFTLVELLLAMAFFSFILVFFTFGFIQINRTFQKGATIKRVTETGRVVIEDVARNVRLSSPAEFQLMRIGTDSNNDSIPDTVNRLCLSNGTRYGWNLAGEASPEMASGEVFSLVKSRSGVCGAPFVITGLSEEDEDSNKTLGANSLIEEGITVKNFNIPLSPSANFNGIRIDVTLGTDDDSLIGNTTPGVCDGFAKQGDQFCDTVRFVTSVTFRAVD